MSVTVSEIEVPRSAVSTTGSTTARASASRSRRSWVTSLRAWARMRRTALRRARSGRGPHLPGPPVAGHDQDEDILQRVVLVGDPEHAQALALEAGRQPPARLGGIAVHDHVDAVAEERDAPVLQLALQQGHRARRVVDARLQHPPALRGLDPARGAL